jgi:hypothetical protein
MGEQTRYPLPINIELLTVVELSKSYLLKLWFATVGVISDVATGIDFGSSTRRFGGGAQPCDRQRTPIGRASARIRLMRFLLKEIVCLFMS